MEEFRILLVDDHALFLEGMCRFLTYNGIKIVDKARSGAEALMKYEMTRPDLVMMDIHMAEEDGIETTRTLKREYPDSVIVILTSDEDEESIFEALYAGASGYLTKGMEPEQLLNQLAHLAQGERSIAPNLAKHMMKLFAYRESQEGEEFLRSLTERQINVLTMISLGYKYKEIAAKMKIKEATVKYHVREIINKLHLANRAQLLDYVVQPHV